MAGKLDKPIIIAGGGIGGLAAALALSLKGYESIVLEQASEFGEIGAGIQLGPNVFRMFKRLGLTDAINGAAWFPDQLIMRDAVTAELVTALPLDDAFRAKFTEPYGVIHPRRHPWRDPRRLPGLRSHHPGSIREGHRLRAARRRRHRHGRRRRPL